MAQKRKNHSQEFQIAQWKRQLVDNATLCFERGRSGGVVDAEVLTAPLYQEIGRLKMEVDFLQKNCERTRIRPSRLGGPHAPRPFDFAAVRIA